MGLNIISKSYNEPVMQSEYSILSEGFKITIQGLTLAAGNQFHVCNGSSDYGLYTGDTYTTSTRIPTLSGNYTIRRIEITSQDD